ncbi:MAG: chloride channel protein [Cyanobacteriota bacterium]
MTEPAFLRTARQALQTILIRALQLLVIGLLVGIACWPLNLIDGQVDQLLTRLPAFGSGEASRWTGIALAMALAPIVVMPLLLWLQSGRWRRGAGSGIPDTMAAIEDPAQAPVRLSASSTLQRLTLWSVASFALFPLGREGPVVQVGGAVISALRQRRPRWLADIEPGQLLAVGAGAGLAAGFNTPVMALVFILEELLGELQARLVWPALVICSVAAGLSGLLGQPAFVFGELNLVLPELDQLLDALPIGCFAGLLGGLFARCLVIGSRWLMQRRVEHPWRWGLLLGAGLSALLLISGGAAGGDGETLLKALLSSEPTPIQSVFSHPLGCLGLLLHRLIGPMLPLAAGVPGGLIDPALTLGAMSGGLISNCLGHDHQIGLVFGMAAGLAGATQLPLMTIAFVVRLVGDQDLLYGLVMAAAVGAFSGRLLLRQPVYHALASLQRAPRR